MKKYFHLLNLGRSSKIWCLRHNPLLPIFLIHYDKAPPLEGGAKKKKLPVFPLSKVRRG